jgi:hypothetical protein
MVRAREEGLHLSRPWGDSSRYDVGVEYEGRILRVQLKSTQYKGRGESYSLKVMGPRRSPCKAKQIDFVAVYLIPMDTWYIVPIARMQWKNGT